MTILDFILLALIAVAAFSGFREGLLKEVFSLLAFIIGILAALKLMHFGVDILSETFNLSGVWLPFAGFMLIFSGVIILTRWVGNVLSKLIHATPLGVLDKIGGAALSLVKWAFGISTILWILNAFDIAVPFRENSLLYPYVESFSMLVLDWVSALAPFANDLVETIREQVEL